MPRHPRLPALLTVGPLAFQHLKELRQFVLLTRAYRDGALSLRKAHSRIVANADEWGIDEDLVQSWEAFRDAASVAEALFSNYFGDKTDLFMRTGEGMPWIGLTARAAKACLLAEEFITWCDQTASMRV
jgi:hypothetical protein